MIDPREPVGRLPLFVSAPISSRDSMMWTIRLGDRVLVEAVDPALLKTGDLVAFRGETTSAVHRLLGKRRTPEGWVLRAQGDSNASPDKPLGGDRLLGRVIRIKRAGRWLDVAAGMGAWRHRVVGLLARACLKTGCLRLFRALSAGLESLYRSHWVMLAPRPVSRAVLRVWRAVQERLLPS